MNAGAVVTAIAAIILFAEVPLMIDAQRVPAGVPPSDVVFVAGKTKLVIPSDARQVYWCPTGRYALAFVSPEAKDISVSNPARIESISVATGQASTLWKSASPCEMDRPLWFAGSGVAIVEVAPPMDTLVDDAELAPVVLRVDARRGKVSIVTGLGKATTYRASPTQPLIVAIDETTENTLDLYTLRPDDPISGPFRVTPDNSVYGTFHLFDVGLFSVDGKSLCLAQINVTGSGRSDAERIRAWYTWNTTTKVLTSIASEPSTLRPRPKPVLVHLSNDRLVIANGGAKATLRPVWITQGAGKTTRRWLISPDSDWAEVSPTNTGVLVLSRGSVSLTPLRRVSGAELAKLRSDERDEASRRAKEVGLALQMYADDNDGAFPPSGDGVIAALSPYLRSEHALVSPGTGLGFVYSPGTAVDAAVSHPAKTVLGYLTTEAGRVVVYADGHTAWLTE